MLSKAIQAAASLVVLAGLSSVTHAQDNPPPLRQFLVATHFHRAALTKDPRPQWDVDKLIPQLKAMGAWGVRDGATWSSVEKVKGKYELPAADRHWVEQATGAGLKIIFVLLIDNKIYENSTDPDAFANYATFMANTFKNNPNVIAFEIWNEPGNFVFRKQYGGEWNGRDHAPWLKQYSILLDKAAAAIKKVNPNVKVIAGAGVAPPMAHLLTDYPEAFKNVDGLVEHPYTYRTPPEVIPFGGPKNLDRDGISVADDQHTMQSLLNGESDLAEKQLGRRLPVWVTEFGFGTFTRQKKQVLYGGFTDTAQAAYHARGLIQGLSAGVATWTIYDLVDDGTDVSDPEQNFGLLRITGEPKPAAVAIKRIAQTLGSDWKTLKDDTGSLNVENKAAGDKNTDEWAQPMVDKYATTGPQVYWYQTPGSYVTFVWNAGRLDLEFKPLLGDLTLTAPANVKSAQAIDLVTGQTFPLKLEKTGKGTKASGVPVGSMPVAVKWITD